jgi:hypothetical protein
MFKLIGIVFLVIVIKVIMIKSCIYDLNKYKFLSPKDIFNICDGEFKVTTNMKGRDMRYIHWTVQCIEGGIPKGKVFRGVHDVLGEK